MPRPATAANLGGRKKDSVYLFIRELIQEGKYAWFVTEEGRFLIKWDKAVELYMEYRATKNPKFEKNTNRRKASNALRAALLHHYEKDGAKEFAESRKLGRKTKVIERQFQMPFSVFQSLFGSRVELPDNRQHASGDQSDTSGISGSDTELMEEDQSLSEWLHENLKYNVDMTPKRSPLQGGDPFSVTFSPSLDAHVTSVHAVFVKSGIVLGNVEMVILPDCLLGRKIPGASSSGWGDVIFKAHHGYCLGSTKIFYYPDEREVVIMVKNPSLFETLCKDMSCHTANSSYNCSDEGTQRSESFGNAQQVQLLCLLVFTAAREGAQQFIEIIFSSSAGRLVFDAYKNSQPLPEVVAKDHGHNKTACYLEGVTKRFLEETFAVEEYPKAIDWSELAKAAEEAQREHECNTENESSDLTSDLSKDAGYLGDLETSSNEPQSSDSEDDIYITSNNVYGDENLARTMDFEVIDVHDVQSLQDTEEAEKFRKFRKFSKMQETIQCLCTSADKLDNAWMEVQKISDISTKDLHLAREEISTNSDNDMDQLGVVQDISPSSSSVKKSKEHVDWDRISPQTIKSTTSVEPSSEETTQFDQAEDEEKTSFSPYFYKFREELRKQTEEFRKLKEELWKQTEELRKQTVKLQEQEVEALKRKVEPSSEETTQFDQAEDEEKTSFLSDFYKFRVPLEIYAQGPEAVKAYGKALTKGKACHKRISLMLIGQDQAGKTSLKKSLKGENFNEKEESTVGIETDSLYLKASTEIWKSGKVKEEVQFDPEDQFGHLATAELLRKISREDMENVAWLSPELDSVSDTKSESVLVPPGKSSAKSSRHLLI